MDEDHIAALVGFIYAELELGNTFAQLARTQFKMANQTQGDSLLAKADQLLQDALRWIIKAEKQGLDMKAERKDRDALALLLLDVQMRRY